MQRISTKSRIYLNNKNKSPSIFLFTDVGIATQRKKEPEKGYHWNDPSRHLHAYSRNEVVCATCFRVNNQGIGVQHSSFFNTDFELVNIGWDNPELKFQLKFQIIKIMIIYFLIVYL